MKRKCQPTLPCSLRMLWWRVAHQIFWLVVICFRCKVWDVTMECGTALHRIGGAISHVSWSPCDTKIFVATESSLIRYRWICVQEFQQHNAVLIGNPKTRKNTLLRRDLVVLYNLKRTYSLAIWWIFISITIISIPWRHEALDRVSGWCFAHYSADPNRNQPKLHA